MSDEVNRPSAADFDKAVDAAAAARPSKSATPPSGGESKRPRRGAAFASVLILGASLWMLWSGLRDPFPVDPEALTQDAVTAVDVARLAVEEYWAREGALPPTLETVGLGNTDLVYTRGEDSFDLLADDGWGGQIGYHGEREGAR